MSANEPMTQEQIGAIQKQVDATTKKLRDFERLRMFANGDGAMVERVARKLADLEPGEDWPSNPVLGGGPCGTRDDEYREGMHEKAREIIAVVFNAREGS